MMLSIRVIRLPIIPLGGLNARSFPLFRPFSSSSSNSKEAVHRLYDDAYRQLQNLDFMTSAKILFSTPPKKKKFGLDFHLVQLFFACMPPLAVYLVAQYARYEIRRMEAKDFQKVELKKKRVEEEEKAKETESNTMEGEDSNSELLKLKVRLDVLEEAVKEIVDETKKLLGGITKDHEGSKKEQPTNLQST